MAREMKDSGIEWIGEIPANWEIIRLKYIVEFEPKCDFSTLGTESVITYAPMENIKNGYYIPKSATYGSLSTSLTPFEENDIVLAKVTPCFENGNIAIMSNLSSKKGLGSSELFVLRAKGIYRKFLFYWLQNREFVERAKSTMTGTGGLKRVSPLFVRNCEIHLPPIEEQEHITMHLDSECTHINSVIEQTRASIEEYKKLKQAVITQAVTKGIRPDRPMKDCGVGWLGTIPSSWTILALKNICTMQSGKNLVSEQITEKGLYPVYGGNGQRGYFNQFNCEGKKILVGRQGALCGNIHIVEGKFWATEHAVITENTVLCDMGFLYYLLIGMNLNQYVSSTAAQPGLAVSTIQNVKTCLPSIEEQKEIAKYLDKKNADIDSLIKLKERFLSELTSYKKSLIYEYVTGKKEVPA